MLEAPHREITDCTSPHPSSPHSSLSTVGTLLKTREYPREGPNQGAWKKLPISHRQKPCSFPTTVSRNDITGVPSSHNGCIKIPCRHSEPLGGPRHILQPHLLTTSQTPCATQSRPITEAVERRGVRNEELRLLLSSLALMGARGWSCQAGGGRVERLRQGAGSPTPAQVKRARQPLQRTPRPPSQPSFSELLRGSGKYRELPRSDPPARAAGDVLRIAPGAPKVNCLLLGSQSREKGPG